VETGAVAQDRDRAAGGGPLCSALHLRTFCCCLDQACFANTTFAPLKQIDAGLLNVGYAEAGLADGPVVLLLHGWPYDIYSFVDVAPLLASAGYRVIVPYLRGYGSTRFLSSETFRNGQQSVVAVDIVALMDVLKIEKRHSAVLIGARGRQTSSRRCGLSAARAWCQ
jgi:alpha/beta hydrolase fold